MGHKRGASGGRSAAVDSTGVVDIEAHFDVAAASVWTAGTPSRVHAAVEPMSEIPVALGQRRAEFLAFELDGSLPDKDELPPVKRHFCQYGTMDGLFGQPRLVVLFPEGVDEYQAKSRLVEFLNRSL